MSKTERDIVEYIVCCISEFASRFNLKHSQAYAYLHRFKGLDFLRKFYDIEHTFSIDDAVEDMTQVCLNNGGKLR